MTCQFCKQVSPSQTAFCMVCGRNQELQSAAFAGTTQTVRGNTMVMDPPVACAPARLPPIHVAAEPISYADFFTRFFAFLIDEAIAGLLALVTYGVIAFMGGFLTVGGIFDSGAYDTQADISTDIGINILFWLAGLLLALLVYALYFVKQETGPRQATIGKSLMCIRVSTVEGGAISVGQSLARLLIKNTFSGLLFLAGFFLAVLTERKQTLHDFVAGSVVVKN